MIYINDPTTQTSLHRIVYQPGDKTYQPTTEARYDAHPTDMPRYKEMIPVGYIISEQMALARNAIQGVKGRRNLSTQTWLMEMLGENGFAVFKRSEWEWLQKNRRA